MDINDLRIAVTLLSFVAFTGIVGWACSKRMRDTFAQAARLPFFDGEKADTAPDDRS